MAENDVRQFHWHEDLIGCPSQCYYYFIDPATDKRYCIYLRWRWQDPWTCELIGCDDTWDLDWNQDVQDFKVEGFFSEDDFRKLEREAQDKASEMFPHIEELKTYVDPDHFDIKKLDGGLPERLIGLKGLNRENFYYKGNRDLVTKGYKVAIIGEANSTEKEIEIAHQLAQYHCTEIVMSDYSPIGIAALKASVENYGKAIAAVISNHINIAPQGAEELETQLLKQGGLLLCHHVEGVTVSDANELESAQRLYALQLLMALADKIVVISYDSGSIIKDALSTRKILGKPIFVVNSDRSGNQSLLQSCFIRHPINFFNSCL